MLQLIFSIYAIALNECCRVCFHSSSAYALYLFLSKTNICASLCRWDFMQVTVDDLQLLFLPSSHTKYKLNYNSTSHFDLLKFTFKNRGYLLCCKLCLHLL